MRPPVSVVMPFAGSPSQAEAALAALTRLETAPGDELILADNSGSAEAAPPTGVKIVRARAERSPSHARNVGAEHARCDWVLFLDSDTVAPPDLIDRYFSGPVADDVGALAGGVVATGHGTGLAARYGAAKSFLDQDVHLAHAYMPRAVAANLLVRRLAFQAIGGFYEGVRAAEDTDFSWRLQRAGWRLESRSQPTVAHDYRTSVGDLRRQWRGYAAGRAWLGRRYDGFAPEPGVKRALGRALRRGDRTRGARPSRPHRSAPAPTGLERGRFLALDALLGVDELAGFTLSNRPRRDKREDARVVLVADHFPVPGDPLVDFAASLAAARVEAVARPDAMAPEVARALAIDYREDDGTAARAIALARLVTRHPLRSARDRRRRRRDEPGLAALAPAVRRLQRDAGARVHPLGGDEARSAAARLAALAGHPLES